MQRRNFRMPAKDQQRGQTGGSNPRGGQQRAFDPRSKGRRPIKHAPEQPAGKDPAAGPQPDDEGRWQDDGGEGGEK